MSGSFTAALRLILPRHTGPGCAQFFAHPELWKTMDAMSRERLPNEQIAFAFRKAENGSALDEICRVPERGACGG
ncbi:hypothetical protein [Methylobacterium oxalidis]|uniref:hypothetical protein n=1 Tax=Methylobacterium oxalidis TaxID=944322 RepID=UPI00331628C0